MKNDFIKMTSKKIKITCECGREITKSSKSRHMKSKIHIKLMKEKKDAEECSISLNDNYLSLIHISEPTRPY